VIGLLGRQSHSPLLHLKIDPVRRMDPPYWLAASECQRIFINIRGQYGIQKNIYIYTSVGDTERPLVAVWPRILIVCTRLSSAISASAENFSFRLLSENNIS